MVLTHAVSKNIEVIVKLVLMQERLSDIGKNVILLMLSEPNVRNAVRQELMF